MSFWLKNAGLSFKYFIDSILVNSKNTYIYLNDILIASDTQNEHLFWSFNALSFLRLSIDKCEFLEDFLN